MDGRRPARADQLSLRSVDELISRGGFVFAGADRRGGRAADRESGRGPLSADVQATYSIRRLPMEREDKHVDAAQPDRVDREEVAGEDRLAVRSEEAAPRLAITQRRRR